MGRTIELRRHTDNDGDRLSEEGVAAAIDLGRQVAGTTYDLVVSTGAQRATQTAANVLAGGGHRVRGGVIVESGLRSEAEDRWREIYGQTGSGHLDDFRSADPEFVTAEAQKLGAALRRVLDRLEDGERALVIGHSPTNEAAVLGLTGTVVQPLGKGAGVVLVEHDGGWDVQPASLP